MIKINYFDERELLVRREIETKAPKPKTPKPKAPKCCPFSHHYLCHKVVFLL